jgi:hypothetical protein
MDAMLVVVALFLSWVTAWAQAGGSAPAAATTATFRQLTQDRFDANARNDRAFYERLLAPHFVVLLPNTFPAHTRQQYLDAEFPPNRPTRPKSTILDLDARVERDSAVVSYHVHEPYPLGGDQPFESRSRRLDTYVRLDGTWRLLSMAVIEVPSWPEVAAVDPQIYSEYAGVYRLSPTISIVITQDSGRLLAQVTAQPRVELFPESATTFFDKTDSPLARTVFVRDASGKVVAQVYRSQGQTLRAPKIK